MKLHIWHLGYMHFLLPVDAAVYGSFDFMRMFHKFGDARTHKLM